MIIPNFYVNNNLPCDNDSLDFSKLAMKDISMKMQATIHKQTLMTKIMT